MQANLDWLIGMLAQKITNACASAANGIAPVN
jgi:hypothetical protein